MSSNTRTHAGDDEPAPVLTVECDRPSGTTIEITVREYAPGESEPIAQTTVIPVGSPHTATLDDHVGQVGNEWEFEVTTRPAHGAHQPSISSLAVEVPSPDRKSVV